MDSHITQVEEDSVCWQNGWRWVCSCGESDTGYPNRERVTNAAHLHRIMKSLKEKLK